MATVTVDFLNTNKARNSTKVPSLEVTTQTVCLLKEQTSVITPTLIIQGDESTFAGKQFPDYNYCYIEDFHRYYFIANITSISALVWKIDCEVDVLASFRTEILATKAFIQYAQVGYNNMIPDTRLPRTDKSTASSVEIDFPYYLESGIYILNVISEVSNGATGFATAYAIDADTLGAVASRLNNTDFWEQLKQQFDDPLSAIISCVWLPISGTSVSSGFTTMKIGSYDTGLSGIKAKSEVAGSFQLALPLHYKSDNLVPYADYRNVEPYSECTIYLPGIGNVQLPLIRILKSGASIPNIGCRFNIDVLTGDIMYVIYDSDDPTAIIMTLQGNFGVQIPVSNMSYNALGGSSATLGAIASTVGLVGSAISGNLGGALASAGGIASSTSGILSASQTATHVKGGIGGRAAKEFNNKIVVTVAYWDISDLPSNIGSTIGRPVMKTGTIGNYSGLVRCNGAYVKCNATNVEHDLISQYVNTSANRIYDGGLIIE